jgi:hypothetical protein
VAATIAEAIPPPTPRIETAANCAEPAKVVADMTIASSGSMPDAGASTPNESANAKAATANGAILLAPSRYRAALTTREPSRA